ncbi:fimbrial protein [Xenorhabdus ishibashii]|uniref:Fimbrial subunit n=1 Tax=Xenorhabdus ishibashii TaxID=1034471 RepID=A0A2D0KCD7_9GAMM|nr:fimbrial protein [Xenorhabdus ishibashii]PHM61101.1 fimbrial subunit [Xenorhabdus ishibashii]
MKLLVKSAIVVAIWSSMIVSAFAINNNGSITFTGKVTKGTCSTAVAGEEGNVMMADVGVGDFTRAGDVNGDTPFKIKLSDCESSGDSSVKIKFTGTQDRDNNKVLENIASGSSAKGVGIGIYKKSGEQIVIGGSPVTVETLTTKDTSKELQFIAKYVATKDKNNITSGQVQARAAFTVEYD